jgi:hypothetical protein
MDVRTDKQPRLFPLVEPERCRIPQRVKEELVSLLAQLIESVEAGRKGRAQNQGARNE